MVKTNKQQQQQQWRWGGQFAFEVYKIIFPITFNSALIKNGNRHMHLHDTMHRGECKLSGAR